MFEYSFYIFEYIRIFVFKIVRSNPTCMFLRLGIRNVSYNKDGPTYLHDLVEIKEHSYNFRYSNTAKLSKPRTTRYGINSFRYTAAKIWNTLPNHFRQISSFNTFKSMLGYWNGSVCSCPSCVSH